MQLVMMLCLVAIALVLVPQVESAGHGEGTQQHGTHWTYGGETGPQFWGETYELCSGSAQSPIDLKPATAYKKPLSSPKFRGYDSITLKNTNVMNNGHSVQMSMITPVVAIMSGGPLKQNYEFLQLHFHWGSEHTVDGKRFPMEMHMVHKIVGENSPKEVKDGLGVAGFLFEISEEDNPALNPLLHTFADIIKPGEKTYLIQTLSVPDLIAPAAKGEYFSYSGSLTTPTCNEVVQWIVFKTLLKISQYQLNIFLSLQDAEGEQLKDNFRPVQPLNGRAVIQTE